MVSQSFFDHLECSRCGEQLDGRGLVGLCACGGPLLSRYRLEEARTKLRRESLAGREASLWRYHEMLPDPGPARVGRLPPQGELHVVPRPGGQDARVAQGRQRPAPRAVAPLVDRQPPEGGPLQYR